MRTSFDIVRDGLSAINAAAEQMTEAQRQLSSGRRISRASDDAAGMQRVIAERGEMATLDSYARTGQSADARLAAVDSILTDVIDQLTAAISTATGARGTTATAETRDAIARGLEGMRDTLLADVNTQLNGRSIFAGSQVTAAPYAKVAGTWTYQGDATAVQIDIDRGRSVSQTWNGQELIQGSDTQDVLTVFDDLVTAVRAGDQAGIGAGIDGLQRAFTRATIVQGRLGADEKSVAEAQIRLADLRIAADTRRSRDEDTNIAEAVSRLTQAETAYKAALGAAGTTHSASLLDYLR